MTALLAALLALPEDTRADEFLNALGFDSDFCDLIEESDDVAEAIDQNISIEEIEKQIDLAQYVPAGFHYLLAYDTDDGPCLLSVRPKTDGAEWWLSTYIGEGL